MNAESFVIDFGDVDKPEKCTVCNKPVARWDPTCELCSERFHNQTCGTVVVDARGDEASYCHMCQAWAHMDAPW